MSWKDTYKNRITTAGKAIKAIKDNDYVVFSRGASFPLLIGKSLTPLWMWSCFPYPIQMKKAIAASALHVAIPKRS